MKLYMHPASSTSRPVLLMIAEHNLDVEQQVVDILSGEHHGDAYAAKNPNKLVPMLEDGDLRITESEAIMKYLASSFDLPIYPKDLKKRAKVDEMMAWANTQLVREYLYHLIYPQIFPHHKRPSDDVQNATLEWGKQQAQNWLQVLNDHIIGADNTYLANNELSIADYFVACVLTVGDITRCDLSKYPNVNRWLGGMRKLGTWDKVNEALTGFAGAMKDTPFVAI